MYCVQELINIDIDDDRQRIMFMGKEIANKTVSAPRSDLLLIVDLLLLCLLETVRCRGRRYSGVTSLPSC